MHISGRATSTTSAEVTPAATPWASPITPLWQSSEQVKDLTRKAAAKLHTVEVAASIKTRDVVVAQMVGRHPFPNRSQELADGWESRAPKWSEQEMASIGLKRRRPVDDTCVTGEPEGNVNGSLKAPAFPINFSSFTPLMSI